MTREEAIIANIVTAIKGLTAASGYSANVSSSDVFTYRTEIVPKQKSEIFSVEDVGDNFNNDGTQSVLNVDIKYGCAQGTNNYKKLRARINDIKKIFHIAEKTMTEIYGYCVVTPQKVEMDIYQDSYEIAEFVASFEIIHQELEQWGYDPTEFVDQFLTDYKFTYVSLDFTTETNNYDFLR